MPLHRVKHAASSKLKNLHGLDDELRDIPKLKMPDRGMSPSSAYNLIHDELLLDGNSRQNLATFCTTWVEPEIRRLMDENIDKNMIDKDEYPQTAEIENRCVHILADLWHAPSAAGDHRLLDDGFQRGRDAGRAVAQMAMAEEAPGRRQIHRQAQSRLWPGAGLLAQIRPLFRRRVAGGADQTGASVHDGGSAGAVLRREHDRRDRDTGRDIHLRVRAGEGDRSSRSTRCSRKRGSTFPSMSMRRAAASWRRSSIPIWCGTSRSRA